MDGNIMKLQAFREIVVSILTKSINDIEAAQKDLLEAPFSDKHYESQQSYEKFLEGRGLEDLLLQMKSVIKALQ